MRRISFVLAVFCTIWSTIACADNRISLICPLVARPASNTDAPTNVHLRLNFTNRTWELQGYPVLPDHGVQVEIGGMLKLYDGPEGLIVFAFNRTTLKLWDFVYGAQFQCQKDQPKIP